MLSVWTIGLRQSGEIGQRIARSVGDLFLRLMQYGLIAFIGAVAVVDAGEDPLKAAGDATESGVKAARLAVQLTAENIANAETTRTGANGGAYRRQYPVIVDGSAGVEILKIARDGSAPIWVYDPKHPHANAHGFVAKPNIDLSQELIKMNYYSNWLEANVAAGRKTKQMKDTLLELTK